jgi:dolichyl-phosphate beta-glucosyltransferase
MKTHGAPALSIVIPAFNEARRIGATLEATCAFLDRSGTRGEVLVVDDGSRDGTAAVAAARGLTDRRVKLLRLAHNRGKGAAVRAGVLAARGQRVLFMDADLATPIEEVAALGAALDEGYDVAVGSRALPASRIETPQSPFRRLVGRAFNALVRALVVDGIRDTQCGFKLFTRRAAQALFRESRVDRFAFDVEILLLCRGRFRVREVPVAWRHVPGSTVSPLRDAAPMALDLLGLRLGVAWQALTRKRAPRLLPAAWSKP